MSNADGGQTRRLRTDHQIEQFWWRAGVKSMSTVCSRDNGEDECT